MLHIIITNVFDVTLTLGEEEIPERTVSNHIPDYLRNIGGVSLWIQERALKIREDQLDKVEEWGPEGLYEDDTIKEALASAARRFKMRQQRLLRVDLHNDLIARIKQSLSFWYDIHPPALMCTLATLCTPWFYVHPDHLVHTLVLCTP